MLKLHTTLLSLQGFIQIRTAKIYKINNPATRHRLIFVRKYKTLTDLHVRTGTSVEKKNNAGICLTAIIFIFV